MATSRVLALQARFDAARDKLDAERDKEAPRDNIVAACHERIKDLKDELNMHIVPAGECSGKHVRM